jgi:hypothetical protein
MEAGLGAKEGGNGTLPHRRRRPSCLMLLIGVPQVQGGRFGAMRFAVGFPWLLLFFVALFPASALFEVGALPMATARK